MSYPARTAPLSWRIAARLTEYFAPRRAGLWLFVALPTALTILYQGLIASDIYVSESAFSIRTERPLIGGEIGALLPGIGNSNQQDQLAVNTYIRSPAILDDLMAELPLATIYGSAEADRIARLAPDASREELTRYYRRMVSIVYDDRAMISALRVRAFDAAEAQRLNEAILGRAEHFVNALSAAMRTDAIAFARAQVQLAENELSAASAAMSGYRGKTSNFDPTRAAGGTGTIIQELYAEQTRKRAELDAARGVMTARNPRVAALQREIAAIDRQIAEQNRLLTADRPDSMTRQIEDYASLALKQEFATKRYGHALAAYEAAQAEAGRQSIYLTRIIAPTLPEDAVEPRRLYHIATVFFLSLAGYGLALLLAAAIGDHIRR